MRVGLVVNRLEDYALTLVAGLSAVLEPEGASLLVLVHPATHAGDGPWLQRLVRAGSVDAVVVTSVTDPVTGASAVADLVGHAAGVPVVTVGAAGHGVPDVSCDNAPAARGLAEHLLSSGRCRPLVVAGPAGNADSRERAEAFVSAATAAGVPLGADRLLHTDFSREDAYRRTLRWLQDALDADGVAVDAVLAANDELALGALDALRTCGLRCPEDVAVVGFDDTEGGRIARPALTSVDQHVRAQGERAAELLLDQLAHRPAPRELRVRVPAEVVVRASSSAGSATAPASRDELAVLRRGRSELVATRGLMALHHRLLRSVDERDLTAELRLSLSRTGVRRTFFSAVRDGAPQLLLAWGAAGRTDPEVRDHDTAELVPPALRGELDRGILVVHQLTHSDQELGVLLYEQEVLDRWSGEALHQSLAGSLAVIARTRQLTSQAAHLEELVAARTRELQEVNDQLQRMLRRDALTGVANRAAFDEHLRGAQEAHARTGAPLSVLMCDVDHFKRYNDAAGHLAGDACLRAVASCIADAVRGCHDLVARYGGEEFAVVLPGTSAEGAARVAERVLERVRAAALPHPDGAGRGVVSLSIGVASSELPAPHDGGTGLLARADAALYRAKHRGRDRAERCTGTAAADAVEAVEAVEAVDA